MAPPDLVIGQAALTRLRYPAHAFVAQSREELFSERGHDPTWVAANGRQRVGGVPLPSVDIR